MSENRILGEAECIRETDKAILVVLEGEEHWVPKSAIHDDSEVFGDGMAGTLVVHPWFARKLAL